MRPHRSRFLAVALALLVSGMLHASSADESTKPTEGSKPATEPSKPTSEGSNPTNEPKPVTGPRLVIDKPAIDVGNVVRGQVAVAVFEVRNTGDQVLTILDARPGCGCTVTSFDKTIPPGKSGQVTANVKTETFRGPIEKSVTVTSTDTSNATLSLQVKANVVGSVEVLPSAYLSFPSFPLMEYSGKLMVRQDKTESGELKITDVTTSAPWLIAKARKVKSAEPASNGLPAALRGDWILDVSEADDAPGKGGGQQVTFKTGLRREPQVTIPIAISIAQSMQAHPPSLIMVVPRGEPTARATFTVAMRPGLGKDTVSARAEPDVFDVTIEQEAERRYKATVVWKTNGDPSQREGSVVISAGQEHLSVPVRVLEKPVAAGAPVAAPDRGQPSSGASSESASDKRTP